MVDLTQLHPVVQAFLGGLLTWGLTAMGAGVVFFTVNVSRRVLDGALGFAAGVMVAASFWSLLAPAIELSSGTGLPAYVPPAIGFLLGGAFLLALDKVVPHLHLGAPEHQAEGVETSWERTTLLALAITLHNIPEGLAVGVAFGAAAHDPAALAAALALAVGIGIQNMPEGMAISVPFRRLGMGAGKSFWWGQLSGFVEVVAAVLGAAIVFLVRPLLPYALAFAAGAMIYVVIEEVVPEAHRAGFEDTVAVSAMVGFAVMMVLDVGLA